MGILERIAAAMSDPSALPRGLVFFPPGTPPARRRRRLVFAAVVLLAALALIWPIYPLFSGVFPLILGLPLSLAWIVGWLFVVMAASLWLYRSEPPEAPDAASPTA